MMQDISILFRDWIGAPSAQAKAKRLWVWTFRWLGRAAAALIGYAW